MNISIEKALGLFDITTVEDKGTLKKIYRQCMKENHPDAGGSEELSAQFNKAFEVLNNAFDNGYFDSNADLITKQRNNIDMSGYVFKEKPLVKLSFEQLDKILNKESVDILLDGKTVKLSKSLLGNCKILMSDQLIIMDNLGNQHKYRLNVSYQYGTRRMMCNAIINNLEEFGEDLEVKVSDKVIKVSRLYNYSSLSYKFDNYELDITVVR